MLLNWNVENSRFIEKDRISEDIGLFTAFFSDDLLLTAQTLLWLAFVGIVSEKRAVEVINDRVKEEKKFLASYFTTRFKKRTVKSFSDRLGWLIEFASGSKVHYDKIISILLKNFKIGILEQAIPLDSIARFYGSQSKSKLEKMMKAQK